MTYSICKEGFEDGWWYVPNPFKICAKFVFYAHHSIRHFLPLNFLI